MRFDRRQFGRGAAALAVSSLPTTRAMGQIAPDAEKALYEAAKKEGSLIYYTAHYSAEVAEAFARGFTEKYPGVVCKVVRTTAQVAYQRLTQELKAGGTQCDVFASTDIGHFLELKSKSQLDKFTPANASTLLPALQNVDKDGFFHATAVGVVAITYNTQRVKPDEAPKKWTDLVDPKWKNQVSVGHPAYSGTVGVWVWQMMALYGWDYFEKLKANNPQIGRSINDTLTMLRSGERIVAASSANTALDAKVKGDPIEIVYPTDGTVVFVSPSAIPKGAKSPNAARLFLEFMTSPQASQIAVNNFVESRHADVAPKIGKPLGSVKTLLPTAEQLHKGIPDVKERWRDTFGV